MNAFYISKVFFRPIYLALVLLISPSCSQNDLLKTNDLIPPVILKPPVVITAGAPAVVRLDTCPPPYYVVMPVKDSVEHIFSTSQGPLHVKMGPPIIKPADFFITMPNYNAEKGLGINSIMSAYCDKKGILWFGTNGGGLTRYDGNSSETFTSAQGIGSNQVRCITEDEKGNIWFVMGGGGVTKYDGTVFTNFTTKDGLANNEVRSVTIDKKGKLWFGTFGGGVSCFDGKSFTNYTTLNGLVNNKIFCSTLDNKGNLWFGSIEGGVSRFDGKTFANFTTEQGLASNSVRCVIEDKHRNLWFGTAAGISKYDGKVFSNFTIQEGLAHNDIFSTVEDRSGNLWFGSFGGGVCCYDGRSFFNITVKQGLPYNVVRSMVNDRSGNIWLNTFSEGASCYYGKSIISFTTNQGLPDNKIWSVFEDSNNNLWFGTENNGVCKFDGKNFTLFGLKQGLYGRNANCIFEDKKRNIWFGTNGGVSEFNGKSFISYTTRQGLAGMQVRHIIEDKNGNIWFASELGGVSKFDGKVFTNFSTVQGLPNNDVRVILENDKGGFWFGSHGGGITYYNGKTFTNLNTDQGLTNNFVFTIIKDRNGNLWIGTGNGGVSILHKEVVEKIESSIKIGAGEKIFENFTTKEGLSDDAAYDVVEDRGGNIVIGTNLGLTLIKNGLDSSIKKIAKTQIEYFNWKVGYPIKDINAESMYVDSKGYIWVGTGQKLIKFDYSAVHKSPDSPLVHIKSLKINNESINWHNLLGAHSLPNVDSVQKKSLVQSIITEEAIIYGKTQDQKLRDSLQVRFGDIKFDSITPYYPLPVNLKLPHKHNSVTFSFAAIEPGRPDQVRYQYMLKNYDPDWNPVTAQTTATFGNIHEGSYTFKIKAQSPDGVWSEPVEYTFEVLPPIWRTWWFICIYIITAGALLSFGLRYRIASVRKKEKEKARHEKALLELEAKALRAQMNPHFIFNCLNSIKALIQNDDKQRATDYLTTFSKLIRTLFQNSDKRQITLYDEIETCRLYTQLETMRLNGKLRYSFDIDPNIDLKSVMVPALIVQPFIENSIWHGIVPQDEGRIAVTVKKIGEAIVCDIDDDGIGRVMSKLNKPVTQVIHESKGVRLSQARLNLEKMLNETQATIEIIDKHENDRSTGTKVVITFNLN